MAPTDLFQRLRSYYNGEPEPPVPAIRTSYAVGLLVLYTLFYVIPLYISPNTRPSPTISRDAPSVIRARIQTVCLSCFVCSVFTFVLCSSVDNGTALHSLHLMGYLPPGVWETLSALFLTGILFLGPLFEVGVVERQWRNWIRLRGFSRIYSDIIDWRNLVMGPVTEEVLFRSAGIPPLLLAQTSLRTTVFLTPLVFGLAHVHHFYEFRLTHPRTPVQAALLRSVFQLGYTTLFGAYATFVFIRTGSLLAVILVHSFCNAMGLPRVWGRLEGPETLMGPDDVSVGGGSPQAPQRLHVGWSVAYYVLLVLGAVLWWANLWTLTESGSALMLFPAHVK